MHSGAVISTGDSSQKRPSFLILGTDTGVGKTVFTGLFAKYMISNGFRTCLVKPFCSGGKRDIYFLQSANEENEENKVNYWYYDKPISPAAWELRTGNAIDSDDVIIRLRREIERKDSDILLVEGVGGLLAPITLKHTIASLGQELDSKLMIIAQNRVGVINHVLLTVEAALSRGLSVASVILMGQEEPDSSADDNAELIRIHMPNIVDFKGIYEFPWLGEEADNPDLIPNNAKKAQNVLEEIFNNVIKPCLFAKSTNR